MGLLYLYLTVCLLMTRFEPEVNSLSTDIYHPNTAGTEYEISLNSVQCGQMHTRNFVQTDL